MNDLNRWWISAAYERFDFFAKPVFQDLRFGGQRCEISHGL